MQGQIEEDFKEEAIPFLTYDIENKRFTLSDSGEELLKSMKTNFGVISVAGMYRTGKSYLLNRMLLNRQSGFSVGPTVNPCTKGLWIWTKPIYGKAEDGSNLPIFVIDTEGFGAFDEDQNHDIKIFTLAILLCSYFVYNSVGSIDENSIQSLNFVINLSKHLQMKSNQKSGKDMDPEEFSSIFPSFLWVLRDFSLQLVDEDGETITAKEYLEKCLDYSKHSFSNDSDSKMKIRKLIKAYFKDRDCTTLVRPLSGEKDLQNLEKLGLDKLRPEFLDQMLQLRKKVLSRVKPKTFKGKQINGEMYINIIKSLIEAMNEGAIPNIENTWKNMCLIESQKAFNEAEAIYEGILRENFDNMDLNEELIRKIYHEAKEKSLEVFNKKAFGEVSTEIQKQLKTKMKEKLSYFTQLHEEDLRNSISKTLQKWYGVIEFKISGGELKNISEINSELAQLEQNLAESYETPIRNEIFKEFANKVLNFSGDFFYNKLNTEMSIVKNENSQIVNKLNNDLKEAKTLSDQELQKKNNSIERYKQSLSESQEALSNLQEKFSLLEKEKEQSEKLLKDKFSSISDEKDRKFTNLEAKYSSSLEKVKELEKSSVLSQSDNDKEKALLEQKIDHYQKQIDDLSKREKESHHELRSQIKEQAQAIKDINSKHEAQVKKLNKTNEELNEKIIELELMISSKDQSLEQEKQKAEESTTLLLTERDETKAIIKELKASLEKEKAKSEEELNSKEREFNSKLQELNDKFNETESSYKSNEENLKNTIKKLQNELAVLKQNNEFLELQVKDAAKEHENQKKYYENIIATLENKTFSMVGHDEFQRKIEEMKLYYEKDKKTVEETFEKNKLIYLQQIDDLKEKNNEHEYRLKHDKEILTTNFNETKQKLEQELKNSEKQAQNLKQLTEKIDNLNNEKIKYGKKLMSDYEKLLEEKEIQHQEQLSEMNRNSEETVNQLKHMFESEKINLEEKLKDEKKKNEKKIKSLTEDYETKLEQLESELNEEIENLNNELNDKDQFHQNYCMHVENDMNNLHQRIELLENYLKEAKDTIGNLQNSNQTLLDQQQEKFNQERKELTTRIELITHECNSRENELSAIRLKRDQLEKSLNEKEKNLSQLKTEFDEERKDLEKKIEIYKSKYQEINDEFMVKKLEAAREIALLKQQVEYLTKKIEELIKQIEESQKRYEERLFSLRSDVEKDLNEKFERLQKEKEESDQKLIQKKKELKEQDQRLNKLITNIEKEKAILNEKNLALETKKAELIALYDKDIEALNSKLKSDLLNHQKDISEANKEISFLKKRVNVLEQELIERNASSEKDQLLWDGKFKFLEQQKDSAKRELAEAQKKFEVSLENFQKKGNIDFEKLEAQHHANLTNIEQKYQQQIKELNENYVRTSQELVNTNKELEREVKSLTFQSELKSKQGDGNAALQKRLTELQEINEKLKKDLDENQKDREAKLNDMELKGEKERSGLKLRVQDLENKVRDLEGKRGASQLEYERGKVKWDLEKDHLNNKITELQEVIDKNEKKMETMVRENQKLKTDKSSMKRQNSGSRILTNQNLTSSYSIQNNVNQTPSVRDNKELSMYTSAKRDYPSYGFGYGGSGMKASNKELEELCDNLKTEENSVASLKTEGNVYINTTENNVNLNTASSIPNRLAVRKFPKLSGEYTATGDISITGATGIKGTSSNSLFNKSNANTAKKEKEKDVSKDEGSDK